MTCARFRLLLCTAWLATVPAQAQTDAKATEPDCPPGVWQHITGQFADLAVHPDTDGRRADLVGTGLRIVSCGKPRPAARRAGTRGPVSIEYEGGSDDERGATVLPDPSGSSPGVLSLWLRHPNVRNKAGQPIKGRAQVNVYGIDPARWVEVSVRARFGPGFGVLLGYPKAVDWLTVSEWWNDAPWTRSRYPFRVSINLVKSAAGASTTWHFAAHGQRINTAATRAEFETLWSVRGERFDVPVAQWMTLRYRFEDGDAASGRLRLWVTPDGGAEHLVLDGRGFTHHPDDPAPRGVSHFNPLKIYTSAGVLGFAAEHGQPLSIDWQALDIRTGR
jgi:hypothetical protein